MVKYCFAALAFFVTVSLNAQYKVHFLFSKLPAYGTATDTIYLAGSHNRWAAKSADWVTVADAQKNGITIDLPKGMFEYKFTLGSWDDVEVGNNGAGIENRFLHVERDTTLLVEIDHWASHFPKKHRETTATKNVHIIDTAFYIPQLNRHRRVWIYLPDSYCTTRKNYPVLYMQDGQNLFDHSTAAFGEWGIDEALDTLSHQVGEAIIVGIDHGADRRINEYNPFDMEQYGKGEGDAYVDFLVQTLMPFINSHYRTKRSARYTAIAGSSMGGLISFYAALKYPNKFGAAGVFSPAFWIAPKIKEYARQRASKLKGRIYFYAGEREGSTMVPDMLGIFQTLNQHSRAKLIIRLDAEGRHSEETWRQEFPGFYGWLVSEEK